jgi:tetratricopeptide (TPR) repeat protein
MKLHIMHWIIGITGAIASCCAWRVEAIAHSRAFRWGGCAVLAGLLLLLICWRGTLVRADLLPMIAACIWWLPFLTWLIFQNLGRKRTPTILERAKTSSSFRMAEAAAKQQDYQEAIRLYRQAAAEHPEDPEPYRCLAELLLEAGLPDDAIAAFRDALKLQIEPDDQLLLAFAISETLAERKKDVPSAIGVLEDFLAEHPDVAGRPFAEGRLQRMRAVLTKNRAGEGASTA